MTILARLAFSGVISAIAASLTSPDDAQGYVMRVTFVSIFALFLLFDALRLLYSWITRNDRMVADLSAGQCPDCKALMTMEVTSEDERTDDGFSYRQTDITCKRCDGDFAIYSSEGGPIVKRIKRC